MKYDLIVFDWDGTLYDSAAFIVECVQAAAKGANLPVPAGDEIRHHIGLSSQEAMRRLFPNLSPFQVAELYKAYQAYIQGKHAPTLFEGSEAVLHELRDKGYLLAIATGKGRAGLDRDLSELGMQDLFAMTRCADESFSKPHPQMMHDILEALDVSPERAVVVGDTEYDMGMAKNAGTDAIAVSYGVHDIERLKGTHVVAEIHDIRELPAHL